MKCFEVDAKANCNTSVVSMDYWKGRLSNLSAVSDVSYKGDSSLPS